ncbi:lipoprotein-releasing system permease protein [Elusimicrobium simillimum]|uniref:ABC transporter permease n=1 Tax=Elusimicrobium simillimum TaxID=3143438 RepID=UPI003C6F9526
MGFELFVAKRYLFAKRKGIFALVTTIIGVAGVAVGVAALITTLGVMTGFQTDIKNKVIGAQSHILVAGHMTREEYSQKIKEIEQLPGVIAAAPNIMGQAIINHDNASMGVMLRGLDPELEGKINNLNTSFEAGSYTAVKRVGEAAAPAAIVLGAELATSLRLWVGDDVVLISPSSIAASAAMVPKMKKFRVSGIIKTGYYEFDTSIVYTNLKDAGEFLDLPDGADALSVKLENIDKADKIAKLIKPLFSDAYTVRTYAEMNSTLYAALKLEKVVMFIILSLIILVAALNIASNLILLGTEKIKDIGILRAMGAKPVSILRIFILEGMLIGVFGIICGIVLALGLCWVIASSGLFELPGDIYYITKIPVILEVSDIIKVVCGTVALCFLAALYPAVRASAVVPTEAIRNG